MVARNTVQLWNIILGHTRPYWMPEQLANTFPIRIRVTPDRGTVIKMQVQEGSEVQITRLLHMVGWTQEEAAYWLLVAFRRAGLRQAQTIWFTDREF